MKKTLIAGIFIVAAFAVMLTACKKEEPVPENPYSKVDYGDTNPVNDTLQLNSITAIHRDILFPKCAVPGCHDGNFEPDFRTVQSSFSTLVYAPIIKNNAAGSFLYRVIPGDTAGSVLHERITNCCFVNVDDRMPQDNIGTGLPASEINRISTWILQGAKDAAGNEAIRPDLEPSLSLYVAVNSTFNVELSALAFREDSLIYNPFRVPSGTDNFYFAALVSDDITPLAQLQYNKLYLSTSMDDFSSAIQLQATFVNVPNQQPVWLVNIPASTLTTGVQYYMRYYVNDGNHPQNTEFPRTDSNDFFKSYWSFILQP